ncbi:hypothetical protein FHS85_000109 [Rhodoligotrophos appendicifer]|uniref:DUF1178 family protein n=1 Tax=Rhodoligotrophos appendicifer TaxID=987056 RepID=UPI00117D8058|nr:DUF1178 family protein [Rhodoligotrophos appendicifer]
MIRYDLICSEGHEFDGWFGSIAGFDRQLDASLVTCPHCGTADVKKAIMSPSVGGQAQSPVEAASFVAAPAPDPRLAAMIEALRSIKKHIEANSENVGPRFAEEARKMHYDEAEQRSIYGEATAEDAHALVEEGIQIQALPRLPEDGN